MDTDDTKVYFFRRSKTEKGAIKHVLSELHITSIDTAEKKVLCKSRRHFGMTLTTVNGHRRLYFLSHQMMLEAIDVLLRAQGFKKRIAQYKFQKKLPDNEIN